MFNFIFNFSFFSNFSVTFFHFETFLWQIHLKIELLAIILLMYNHVSHTNSSIYYKTCGSSEKSWKIPRKKFPFIYATSEYFISLADKSLNIKKYVDLDLFSLLSMNDRRQPNISFYRD